MKQLKNITSVVCVLLLLALTAGFAAAANDNSTNDVADTVTNNVTVTGKDVGEIVDDIKPYNGSIGPENFLYGLKIAFEKVDLAFTFNETKKLGKQVSIAKLRIAEAKAELRKNNTEAANRALELYNEQMKSANSSAAGLNRNNSGIFNAQKNVAKHQYVLERLLESHPNNTGLQRAYNNSLVQEENFESKTDRKLERVTTKDRRVILKSVRKEEVREGDEENETEVEAEISGNSTKVKVKVEFVSGSNDNNTIAQEILDRIRMKRDAISGLINIETGEGKEGNETEEGHEKVISKLKADAETVKIGTRVKAEYEYSLNTTDKTGIVDAVYQKLSALTQDDVRSVLKIENTSEVKELREKKEETEDKSADRNDKRNEVKELREKKEETEDKSADRNDKRNEVKELREKKEETEDKRADIKD